MKRRAFFKHTLLPVLLSSFKMNALAGSPLMQSLLGATTNGRVLVIIQLAGGNDGLNTVIPIEFYSAYKNARPNIAIEETKILRLQGHDKTGLNPAMGLMQQLFNEDKLAIIQAVSYPKPNFSHFKATDIWLTGEDSDKDLNTGWMGSYLNKLYPDFPNHFPNSITPHPLAIQIGSVVSPAFQGPSFPMAMAISNPDNFYKMLNENNFNPGTTISQDQIDYIRQIAEKTDAYSDVIKLAAKKITRQSSKYPAKGKNSLADQLQIVSRLIAGGLETKIYMVSMGGFDTHANQTEASDTSHGTHANLLQKISEAVDAFMDDLKLQNIDDRVVGMTFSEFGRRIKSNASGGTDHGVGAPVFVFGKPVSSDIIGNNPLLPDNATNKDNIAMQTDFRSVYSTLLKNWLGAKEQEMPDILINKFTTLPIIKNAFA